MALGLLIAGAIAGICAVLVWYANEDVSRDDNVGLVPGILGIFASVGVFIGFVLLSAILLVMAAVVWIANLF